MKKWNGCSLLNHNTFGIEAKARLFVEYGSVEELQNFVRSDQSDSKMLHIGQGSNLLFTQDFDGIVFHCNMTGTILEREDENSAILKVGAGMPWDDFVAFCVDHGYYGLENLSQIPGEVGASAVQNIGAYGAEVKKFIESVEVVNLFTGELEIKHNVDCGYAYRYSNFKGPWRGKYAVTHVWFSLDKTFRPNTNYAAVRNIVEEMGADAVSASVIRQKIIDIRKEKLPDPNVLGNAGSFFMNPIVEKETFLELQKKYPDIPYYEVATGIKIPAGWLIEKCGWKGRHLGRAGIYEKQALVIVNLGGATGNEIVTLSHKVSQEVYEKFGISIKPEVNWI
jgi:UDP-N-acetylmuramate dehydrogenase